MLTFLPSCLLKQRISIRIGKSRSEIIPQWLITAAFNGIKEELTMEQLTRTQQISWWRYGLEIIFLTSKEATLEIQEITELPSE